MDLKQAIQVLGNVCSQYKGTLEEHQTLQRALAVVGALEVPKPEAKPKKS